MKHGSQRACRIAGAALAMTLAWAVHAGAADDTPAAATAADIRLPDSAGKPRALKEWAGRPVLLNYWASWCGPCLKEIPELQRFSRQQRAGGVQVVGIALDEAASIRAFLARTAVDYPVLIETVEPGEPGSSRRFGNQLGVLPYSVLLDAQGRVLRTKLGPLTGKELAEWSAALPRK